MQRIDYFLSTLSPYTYLAGDRLERLAGAAGAEIAYRPLDVGQLFARTGGVAVKDRHPSRLAYRAQDLVRVAARTGMPFNLRPAHWPANAAPSSYAIIAASRDGNGDTGALVRAILAAVWAEERDIADDAVIRDCLERSGFDPGLADRGLLTGAEIYVANLEEAVSRGVFGVPSYLVGDQLFWGQDRLDDLQAHLAGQG